MASVIKKIGDVFKKKPTITGVVRNEEPTPTTSTQTAPSDLFGFTPTPPPIPSEPGKPLPPTIPIRTMGGGGTYNPDTGVYTSPTGQSSSTATPPERVRIVGSPAVPKSTGPSAQQLAYKKSELGAREERRIYVQPGGGVRVKNKKYIGGAYVPELGTTANVTRSNVKKEGLRQGMGTNVYARYDMPEEKTVVEEMNEGAVQSQSIFLPVSFKQEKTEGVFDILKTSESYGELGSGLYQKVPYNWRMGISNVKTSFVRGVTTIAGSVGVKIPSLEKVYSTSPLVIPEAQFLLLGLGATPKAVGLQKLKITEPLRQPKKSYALETIRTDVVQGKPIRYSDYTIVTEKAPPRRTYTTSLNEMAMGKAPKNIKYLPAITSKTRTPFYASSESPFITLESKGIKVGKLAEVSGDSVPLDILKYKSLPKQDQFLVKRLAEAKTGGVPVSEKNIFKILKPDELRFVSNIEVQRLGKFRMGKRGGYLEPLKPRKLGTKPPKYADFGFEEPYLSVPQKTTRFRTITETKLLPVPEGVKDVVELSKSKILFKDVTKPFSRARGKTPDLPVYTTEFLEPRIVSQGSNVRFMQPADIPKTPFSKTFQLQRQEIKTLVRVPPPKVVKAKTTITKATTQPPRTTIIPSSAYVGLGLYERTEGGQIPSSVNTFSLSPSKVRIVQEPRIKDITKLETPQKEISKGTLKMAPKEITKEVVRTVPKEIEKTSQKPMQRLIPKMIQKEITKNPQKIITLPPLTSRISSRGRKNLPRIHFPKVKSKQSFKGYNVFVRRFGKFKPIAKGVSLKEAFLLGRGKTKRTLGATFTIPGAPKVLNIPGYKTKKTKKGTVYIELPKYRLSTPTEKAEIKYYKKVKGGRR